jgi:hypothetical protein
MKPASSVQKYKLFSICTLSYQLVKVSNYKSRFQGLLTIFSNFVSFTKKIL